MKQDIIISVSSKELVRYAFSEADTHIVITAKKGVQGIVSLTLSPSGNGSHMIEVHCEDDAELHVSLNVESLHDVSISQRATIGANAKLTWHNVSVHAAKLTQDLVSTIEGEQGMSTLDWLFMGDRTDKQTLSARTVFNGRNGSGEMIMRGIAEEKAHVVCNGMIDIGRHGGGTNTYLTQQVLMLDPTAKVDAIPGLEIKTNDVKASHSASVARVTEADLFYFAARGIDEKTARRMYVEGYANEIIERIPDEEMRRTIVKKLRAASY